MRNLGWSVVLLGLAALGLLAIDANWNSESVPAPHAAARHDTAVSQRVIVWAALVGGVALAMLARGLGELVMTLRDRNAARRPGAPNGDTAAMIDAEVNEGGRPSPTPCDTPAAHSACQEVHPFMDQHAPMIETCPASDRILHLPLGDAVATATSTTLLKSAGLELIRLVVPAGKTIPPHRAPGEITVQCIEGRVAFEHDGRAVELQAGDLLFLCPQELHALRGIANSSVLVTRLRPHAEELPEKFPAP